MKIEFTATNGKKFELSSDNFGFYLCEGYTTGFDNRRQKETQKAVNLKEQTYLRPMLRTIENELLKNTKAKTFKELNEEIKEINNILDMAARTLKINLR